MPNVKAVWPRDNQQALIDFYGTPGPEVEAQLVPVVPPFRMTYEGKPIKSIRFHRKAATALLAALNEIWDHYGRDQATIDRLGISRYAGAYNPRFIRGSTTKWSNHAYGAAIDLNAEDNGFGKGHGTIPQPVIDAFKRQGARWGGDYKGRTDPMHFEFCDNGGQVVAPVQRLADAPPADSDSDADSDADPPAAKPPTRPDDPGIPDLPDDVPGPTEHGLWALVKRWKGRLSLGGLGGAGIGLYDWRAITVILVGIGALISGGIWLMGPENVRGWIRRQVNK